MEAPEGLSSIRNHLKRIGFSLPRANVRTGTLLA